MRMILFAAALGLAAVAPALAEDAPALKGSVYLDAENCTNGTKGPDCVLTFFVEGEAAKILYNGLPGKGQREECTGGLEKMDGHGLHCIMAEDKTYSCEFGYHFAKKSFGAGGQDC
jgi:hypothetical protein